jgi:hypothetical protein
MIRRRELLAGVTGVAVVGATGRGAQAYEKCMFHPMYGQVCEAGVEVAKVVQRYDDQDLSQWCWAATISMIFAQYGYQVGQPRIVKDVYGVVVNMPALSGATISKQLTRTWTDDTGKKFNVQVEGLYDFDAGIVGITNAQIVNALKAGRPLVFGNQSHAMMQCSVAYMPTPMGPQIINVGFADPWPGNGLRGPAYPGEALAMHVGGAMRYLALPKITPA